MSVTDYQSASRNIPEDLIYTAAEAANHVLVKSVHRVTTRHTICSYVILHTAGIAA